MQHSSSTNPTCTKASWKPRGNHHAIPTSQLTPMQKKVSRSTIAAARLHPQFGLKLPPLLLKSGLLHTHTREATLMYLINKLACLTISPLFSTQLAHIGSCSLYLQSPLVIVYLIIVESLVIVDLLRWPIVYFIMHFSWNSGFSCNSGHFEADGKIHYYQRRLYFKKCPSCLEKLILNCIHKKRTILVYKDPKIPIFSLSFPKYDTFLSFCQIFPPWSFIMLCPAFLIFSKKIPPCSLIRSARLLGTLK